jgi:TRAP-type C4-dicarboxylate transport system permease small subunit
MNGAERKPEGVIGRLEAGGGFLGRLGLVFMVVSITYDVVLRYVFVAPTYWALEVNTFLLAFLCVIPAGDVLRVGSQIRITFLYDRLTPAVKARLDILRAAAGLFFCGIMIWKGGDMAWVAWLHNDRMSTSLGTPMVIPYLFLPIGFLLLALQYLSIATSTWRKSPAPPEGQSPSGKQPEVEQQI